MEPSSDAPPGARRPALRRPSHPTRPRHPAAPILVALLLAGVAVACAGTGPPRGPADRSQGGAPPPRLVVISWDGAGDVLVDRLLTAGRLPNLAALAAAGVAADHSVTSFPSKTAAGHASLWTGAWPATHGVTANRVPAPATGGGAAPSLLESVSGFDSAVLTAEPLYVTAARAGRRVVVLSATQSEPADPHLEALRAAGVPADLPPHRLVTFSGFEYTVADPRTLDGADLEPVAGPPVGESGGAPEGKDGAWPAPERRAAARQLRFEVGDCGPPCRFHALTLPAADGRPARLLVRQGSRDPAAALATVELEAVPASDRDLSAWSPPFRVRRGDLEGFTYLRLFALAGDGNDLLLYQRAAHDVRGHHGEALRRAYRDASPGFHDRPFRPYEAGDLGTPLPLGGDGRAEARLLELVAFDLDLSRRRTRLALERWGPDVLFDYTPMSDDAGHTWGALADPGHPFHDPVVAAAVEPFHARVLELQDRWLGEVVAAAGPRAVVAVVSDHGMAGIGRYLHVNRVLEAAGLLARDADGGVDLTRTRALAVHPEFGVRVNGTERRGGIVPPGERAAVTAAVEEALLGLVDPATGRHPVVRVFRPADAPGLGLPGPPAGADVYYDLRPGYYPQQGHGEEPAGAGPAPAAIGPPRLPWGEGHHGYWPERRDMHAIFYAAGPGLARGVSLGPVRHTDVAPTLARAVALPPPADATGRVVAAALAEP